VLHIAATDVLTARSRTRRRTVGLPWEGSKRLAAVGGTLVLAAITAACGSSISSRPINSSASPAATATTAPTPTATTAPAASPGESSGTPITNLCDVAAIGSAVTKALAIDPANLSCANNTNPLSATNLDLSEASWTDASIQSGSPEVDVSIVQNSTSSVGNWFQTQLDHTSQPMWSNPPSNLSQVPDVDGLRTIWFGQASELMVSDGPYDITIGAGDPNDPSVDPRQIATNLIPVVLASGFGT
jgi:hypothetical protein